MTNLAMLILQTHKINERMFNNSKKEQQQNIAAIEQTQDYIEKFQNVDVLLKYV